MFECIYIHTGLIPNPTKDWIASHGLVNNLVYPLIEEGADMFRKYRVYLYTGKVASKDEDVADETSGDTEWHELILMHTFATKIRDEKFANTAINALVEKVQEEDNWPTDLAHDVYDETKNGDPLRRLYVDLHVWLGMGEFNTVLPMAAWRLMISQAPASSTHSKTATDRWSFFAM